MHPRIYLCGGINGLSDSDASDWRAAARERLSGRFEIVDPMSRDYRGRELANVSEIVEGDLRDIAECKYILVNALRPSWGTAMEVAFASPRTSNRVVVAVCDAAAPSPWLIYHTSEIVTTFEDAFSSLLARRG